MNAFMEKIFSICNVNFSQFATHFLKCAQAGLGADLLGGVAQLRKDDYHRMVVFCAPDADEPNHLAGQSTRTDFNLLAAFSKVTISSAAAAYAP